ncbi:DUF1992 domain-containing protein [Demequina iriomotensis]|uniref:DnaJ family domain-containing protein n=1 Tax=Demequina iriomotensis TaxID=1536641 RepID=UPI00078126C4|nr:DUF1992 domain-containing protein [Demequina iriomotensis]
MRRRRATDPALDAARYASERDERDAASRIDDAPVTVARMAADRERREQEERAVERRRRDRAATQHLWVERQITAAQERGDFDDLPGAGKPIPGLTRQDPDWWVRGLVEREHLTGLGPESVMLRREDAELEARLDGLRDEREVREGFNARVRSARCRPADGPPLVTPTRDADEEVRRWRARSGR